MLKLGACTVDLIAHEARWPRRTEVLTAIEVKLLAYLVSHGGQVLSRAQLLHEVWGYAPGVRSRTMDNTVARVRTKIEEEPRAPKFLQTVRGKGYVLQVERGSREVETDPLLIGREQELKHLAQLEEVRLITLIGPPGIGKSHLLKALMRVQRGWFVDLVGVQGPLQIASRLVEATGHALPRSWSGELASLAQLLPKQGVLTLDNAETCLDEVRVLAEKAPPNLRIRVSSRVPLSLTGEHLIPLQPLRPEHALALLTKRVGRIDPDFTSLVEVLGCLPLAIELAAGRLRHASVGSLMNELERSSAVLSRLGGGRHDSLNDVIELAWTGLSAAQRQWLSRLSVFKGVFDSELASWVLHPAPSAITAIDELVACALVHPVERAGRCNGLRLLPVIRERARRELADAEAVYVQVASALLELVEVDEEAFVLVGSSGGLVRFTELHEVAVTTARAIERHTPELALRLWLRIALVAWWYRPPAEVVALWDWVRPLCAGRPEEAVVRAFRFRATCRVSTPGPLSNEGFNTPLAKVHYHHHMAIWAYDQRRVQEGLQHTQRMHAQATTLNSAVLCALADERAAQLHRLDVAYDEASACFERAMPILSPLPMQWITLVVQLATLRTQQGLLIESEGLLRRALAQAEALKLVGLQLALQSVKALNLARQENFEQAAVSFVDLARGFARQGAPGSSLACRVNSALAWLVAGEPEEAREVAYRGLHEQLAGHTMAFLRLTLACALAATKDATQAEAMLQVGRRVLAPLGDPGDQLAVAEAYLQVCSGEPVPHSRVLAFETSLLREALLRRMKISARPDAQPTPHQR